MKSSFLALKLAILRVKFPLYCVTMALKWESRLPPRATFNYFESYTIEFTGRWLKTKIGLLHLSLAKCKYLASQRKKCVHFRQNNQRILSEARCLQLYWRPTKDNSFGLNGRFAKNYFSWRKRKCWSMGKHPLCCVLCLFSSHTFDREIRGQVFVNTASLTLRHYLQISIQVSSANMFEMNLMFEKQIHKTNQVIAQHAYSSTELKKEKGSALSEWGVSWHFEVHDTSQLSPFWCPQHKTSRFNRT